MTFQFITDEAMKIMEKVKLNFRRVDAGYQISSDRPHKLEVIDEQIHEAETELNLRRLVLNI